MLIEQARGSGCDGRIKEIGVMKEVVSLVLRKTGQIEYLQKARGLIMWLEREIVVAMVEVEDERQMEYWVWCQLGTN